MQKISSCYTISVGAPTLNQASDRLNAIVKNYTDYEGCQPLEAATLSIDPSNPDLKYILVQTVVKYIYA